MMYLTVIVNILTLTTAIRVPNVWPEQEKQLQQKVLQDQHTRSSNVHLNNLFNNKLNVEQHRPDANTYVENKKIPIRLFAQSDYLNNNNNNKQRFYVTEKPYVDHNVPYLYNSNPSLRIQAPTNAENNNDRKVIKYNRVDTTVRHNNLKMPSFSRPLFNISSHNNNFPTDTDDWMPITGHIHNHKIKESNNFDLLHDIKSKQNKLSFRQNNPTIKPTHKLSKDKINLLPTVHNKLNGPQNDYIDDETDPKIYNNKDYNENYFSEHETPKEYPTRPVYPGEGKWAIRGLKHSPYKIRNSVKPSENTVEEVTVSTTKKVSVPTSTKRTRIYPKRQKTTRPSNKNANKPSRPIENSTKATSESNKVENNKKLSKHVRPKRPITYPVPAKSSLRQLTRFPAKEKHVTSKPVEESKIETPKLIKKEPTAQSSNAAFSKQEKLNQFPYKNSNRVVSPVEDSKQETSERNENIEDADEDHENVKEDSENEAYTDEDEDNEKEDFVPTRVFSQVRNTETEEYLPSHLLDTRLKESIKDSKIHTVYTEEGYEDIEYDHGGQEKDYKNSEGNVEFDKDAPKTKKYIKSKPLEEEIDVLKEFEKYDNSNLQDDEKKDLEDNDSIDAETSASDRKHVKFNGNLNTHKFGKSKESRTTEIRNMNNGGMQLEITSEIKTMTQPNNISSVHKFVKIVPKYNKNTKDDLAKRKPIGEKDGREKKTTKRNKRYVNDFPKIEVEKDFLDVFTIENVQEPIVSSTVKYPYYNIKDPSKLNLNSPLRYAEDLKRVPEKLPGQMSFYEQSKISECPEIPRNIDPVAERANGEENKENGSTSKPPDLPRLKNLGSHLDCLKNKLFGENPLDSPIFKESVIEPPQPIFNEFIKLSERDLQPQGTILSEKMDSRNVIKHKDLEDKDISENIRNSSTDNFVISERQPKSVSSESNSESDEDYEIVTTQETETEEPLPESAPLVIRIKVPPRKHIIQKKVLRVNRHKSTTLSPFQNSYRPSRIPPRYKTISEVFYKDDIQPNEQLNVLQDVMNNIKSSSIVDPYAESSELLKNTYKPIKTQFGENSSRKVKVPSRKVRIKHNDLTGNYQTINNYIVPTTTTTTTTTTIKPKRRIKTKRKSKPSAVVYQEYINAIDGQNPITNQKDNFASSDSPFISATVNTDLEEVVGLSPPVRYGLPTSYSSITNFNSPANHLAVEKPVNTFIVEGMNPPIKRKPISYSEFRLATKHRPIKRVGHYHHHVYKRSSNKPNYSEIRRNRPTEASISQTEEDDYEPQRHRNYYYDTKTRKVVYIGPQTEEPVVQPEEVEEECEEEEEDGQEYLTLEKATTSKPFVILTTESEGRSSFLDFVKNLHKDSNYKDIPEPTKSNHKLDADEELKNVESNSQAPTVIPHFINFLSNLKNSENYTDIPEKKVVTTTTESPVEEEEEEEEVEEAPKNNLNNHNIYGNTQIFDISEYLPVPESYHPKTINYSKYKTINRTPASVKRTHESLSDDESSENGQDSASDPTENSQIIRRTQVLDEVTTPMYTPPPTKFTVTESSRVESTTQLRKVITRGRKRPTTTTSASILSTKATIRLNSRRRSRPTTSTTEPNAEEEYSTAHTRRIPIRRIPVRRISRGDTIPSNHKEVYTPIDENIKISNVRINPKNEILNLGNSNDGESNRHEVQTRNIANVEVFKNFNRKQKHGGNYRKEELELNSVPPTAYKIENVGEMRLTDVVPQPFAYYTDKNLPTHVNLLNVPTKEKEKLEDVDEAADETSEDTEDEIENVDSSKKEESQQNSEEITEKPIVIVKDPSKRLYYYAPVK